MCKSEGMGRQNLFAIQWSVLVQKYEDEVLVRYFCHTKDFVRILPIGIKIPIYAPRFIKELVILHHFIYIDINKMWA